MTDTKLGGTGRYPFGHPLAPDDQGELASSLTIDQERGLVKLNFGVQLSWLVMTAEEADKFIEGLQNAVRQLRG